MNFLMGFAAGVGCTCACIGAFQLLITKGYMIAVELLEGGWNARDLRAHRKAAIVLPFIQSMREQGGQTARQSAK